MKRWQIAPPAPDLCRQLSAQAEISPLTAQLLINRGLTKAQEIERFLHPKLADLKDPFDIPDIKKAAERVLLAKERGEKVVIYGDYDVDGVTGTTILLETLSHLELKTSYYIPLRYGEGYSLNREAIEKLKKEGTNLILTVDCGISSQAEIKLANSLGMEVIVTDHHNLPQALPPAFAIVNPKLIEAAHPSKDLAGAGVAFKFAWALLRAADIKASQFLTELLDLVALGTIADVVPLTQENRILTIFGMHYLNQKRRLGIKCLIEAAALKKAISIRDVAFALAPRLNAAGRLEHASLSVELLTVKDPAQAKTAAQELNRINTKRQGIGQKIQEEVLALLSQQPVARQKLIIHSGEGWHPGVIGITASQLVDRYYRPAVLIGVNEGVGRGSGRSIEGFSIYELLAAHSDLLEDFGGHQAAAGFEIKLENIEELKRRLHETCSQQISDELFSPLIKIDAQLTPLDISLSLIKEIESLGPFGEGNPVPLFMTANLKPVSFRRVGSDSSHLKAKFSDGSAALDVIGFGQGQLADTLSYDKLYSVAYKLETNLWDGFEVAQLNVADIQESRIGWKIENYQ